VAVEEAHAAERHFGLENHLNFFLQGQRIEDEKKQGQQNEDKKREAAQAMKQIYNLSLPTFAGTGIMEHSPEAASRFRSPKCTAWCRRPRPAFCRRDETTARLQGGAEWPAAPRPGCWRSTNASAPPSNRWRPDEGLCSRKGRYERQNSRCTEKAGYLLKETKGLQPRAKLVVYSCFFPSWP